MLATEVLTLSKTSWLLWTRKNKVDGRTDETVSASRSKIEDKGKDEPAEPDSQLQESWQKLAGRKIVDGNRLQENLVKSVSWGFCHADVTFVGECSLALSPFEVVTSWSARVRLRTCPWVYANFVIDMSSIVGPSTGHWFSQVLCNYLITPEERQKYIFLHFISASEAHILNSFPASFQIA